jgi:hypothetical protein
MAGYNLGRWEERRSILQKGGQNEQRCRSGNALYSEEFIWQNREEKE